MSQKFAIYLRVKTILVRCMVDEGAIDEQIADEWCENHSIMLIEKSFFRTITDRWRKDETEKDSYQIKVVRLAK